MDKKVHGEAGGDSHEVNGSSGFPPTKQEEASGLWTNEKTIIYELFGSQLQGNRLPLPDQLPGLLHILDLFPDQLLSSLV